MHHSKIKRASSSHLETLRPERSRTSQEGYDQQTHARLPGSQAAHDRLPAAFHESA